MYVIRYEKTLPPWLVSQDEVEADDPEDAVKEFYKRHDSWKIWFTAFMKKQVCIPIKKLCK